MKDNTYDIIIVGAGLCGLTLAYLLVPLDYDVVIVEARNRIGGRIHTLYKPHQAPIELGATWFGKKHQSLVKLLHALDISYFEQYIGDHVFYDAVSSGPHQIELFSVPPNQDPSYRIEGGSHQLIEALVSSIPKQSIRLGQKVESVYKKNGLFLTKTSETMYKAPILISTLPPALLAKVNGIKTLINNRVYQTALLTHTWMAESIKIGLSYKEAFWKFKQTSGTIFSKGPITEIYDHSDAEHQHHALVGFLDGRYVQARRAQRLMVIMDQLRKYYGPQVEKFIRYDEYLWRDDPYTYTSYPRSVMPHQHNGNPIFNHGDCTGFYLAGSETARTYPGYMDGAVSRAYEVFGKLQEEV